MNGTFIFSLLAAIDKLTEHKRSTDWGAVCKVLILWSGRRGSNPRRPAWEDDSKLETKGIAFPGTSFWRLRTPSFHSVL